MLVALLAAVLVVLPAVTAGAAGSASALTFVPLAAGADPCAAPVHEIACENSKPGNPASEWDLGHTSDPTIEGYTTQMSVDQGETVQFKLRTPATNYRMDIYRLGYYGGDGARRAATFNRTGPHAQPACLSDPTTGLIDCGNWSVSTSWTVPADAVSGVYVAKLTRTDTGGENHVVFVVRDDDGGSNLLLKTADATWQAYNRYGGNSLYVGAPAGRAYKVSYNRPFTTRDYSNHSWLFSAEYPMIRFLERNGYDVSYTTDVDTDRNGNELLEHETFVSVGHDEYWSKTEREKVEAARNAGVNLAFFSGNEVFWKTRWEQSIDGSATARRTLVSYKETIAGAKIDPSPEWTGTWRDPRFSPPADGGRPENALTGTIFTVNGYRTDAIVVPQAEGRMRIWRHTSLQSLPNGGSATFPAGTLGYEWDSDLDNGSRPAGLVRLSSTTVGVETLLLDYGSSYGTGTATHNLTLYRASSDALVFGAGTVQWSWGLDQNHDDYYSRPTLAPDSRMQQATVNLLADMDAQPATIQSGLVQATKSTDTTGPTATITSPTSGTSIPSSTLVTVTGTATDIGGGEVGAVEVSVDGGTTWRRASGRSSWTYAWNATGTGSAVLKARAVDDSANIGAASAGVTVNVACPCSIFGASVPTVAASTDTSAVELGVRFRSDAAGYVTGVRFYKGAGNGGTHVGSLWTGTGTLLGRATFTGETATGWQSVTFDDPVAVQANTTYVASYHAPVGRYAVDRPYFNLTGVDSPPLHALKDGLDGGNGLFAYASSATFPNTPYQASNYWVDVLFATTIPPDTTPPTVASVNPAAGSTNGTAGGNVTASFSEPLDPATVTASTVELRTAGGALVQASVTWNATNRSAVLDPAATLGYSTSYTATVKGGSSGVKDRSGNPLGADYTWSFTTAAPPTCPCTVWPTGAVPDDTSVADGNAVEVGLKFRTDLAGWVNGVRFYKGPGNNGTHTGSLWTAGGTLLARVTFIGESASGWQTASFAQPIQIAADTTYVVSYHAPNGRYARSLQYFGSTVESPPLRALASGVSGVNGVYTYSSSPVFPTTGYQSSNYWVDLSFSLTGPPDSTPPTVVGRDPAVGATEVATDANVVATFSEPLDPASATSTNVQLLDPSGVPLPAALSYDGPNRTVTLDPTAALSRATTYTVRLRGGANGIADAAGNRLAADVTWTFQTKSCPCTIWSATATPEVIQSSDESAVEVGLKFRADTAGWATGVRFYKGPDNTGTHVGSLWSTGGSLLARVTFTGESASGWQQATFDAPVAVNANTTYVVSYHAPRGRFSSTRPYFDLAGTDNPPLHALRDGVDGGNGVFDYASSSTFPTRTSGSANYWVDVVFATTNPPDTTPPVVVGTTPAQGSSSAVATADVIATFNEAMLAVSVGGSTFELRAPDGQLVPSTVTYDPVERTARLDPSVGLQIGATYTATVKGGAGGIADLAGNTLAGDVVWSFTTALSRTCPCTIWAPSATPDIASMGDTNAVELGLKFNTDLDGTITGIRFYKGPANTGVHVGSLWTSSGTLLRSATFTGETATGWQQVSFASPVAITAGTTYVASYFAPNGGYSRDRPFFDVAGTDNTPLHALKDGLDGANSVYAYTATGTFPVNSSGAANYWVDVVFDTAGAAADTTPPSVSIGTPADGATVTGTQAVSATATDDRGVVGVRFELDGSALGAEDTTPPFAVSWNSRTVANGSHQLRAIARDAAGNNTTSSVTNVTTDNDFTPPTVVGRLPAPGSAGVSANADVTVTFGEPMLASSIGPATIELRDAGNQIVQATVSYDSVARTARLDPAVSLASLAGYTATVKGGANGVADVAGNQLALDSTWSFTTAARVCPCSIWGSTATPATIAVADTRAIELGVKFRADVAGFITGIRFYKATANTGTHVGSLWSITGALLARGTFVGETASGWQQVTFATPIPVAANTTYVASYFAPVGRYSRNRPFFLAAGVDNPPLSALQNGVSGGNGVYRYTPTSAFPTSTNNGANYWVDVAFTYASP